MSEFDHNTDEFEYNMDDFGFSSVSRDVFVENADKTSFTLVSAEDDEYSLANVARSERMRELLEEHGLEVSCLGSFLMQVAEKGSVDRDLVTAGSEAIMAELEIIGWTLEHDESGYDEDGNYIDVPYQVTTDERLHLSVYGMMLLGEVVDKDGYNLGYGGFKIDEKDQMSGVALTTPIGPIMRYAGVKHAVDAVDQLKDNPNVTHYVGQHPVTYNEAGVPVSVSNENYWVVGSVDEDYKFTPYATILDKNME